MNLKSFFKRINKNKRLNDYLTFFKIMPTIWIVLFFVFPLFIVFCISFAKAKLAMPPYTNIFRFIGDGVLELKLHISNYILLFKDSYYQDAFLNSALLSIISTIICLIIGYMIAYGISRIRENMKSILLLLVSLSFWTSFLIRIYAWMNILNTNGILNTWLLDLGLIDEPIKFIGNYYAVCLGFVFCYLPFMVFPIFSSLDKLDVSYLEAANDLGASPIKTFWKITIPLSKSGIVTGCILVLSASIGEFLIPELLGGPDNITIGRVLWMEFFNNINWPVACAMSITMILLILFPAAFFRNKNKP